MKIVINNQYGGFGLSILAIKEFLKLKGKEAYFYKMDYRDGIFDYTKIDNLNEENLFADCFTKDFGKKFNSKDISEEEFEKYSFYEKSINRTDKDLIEIVEKLGKQANTMCSALKIIEIPDDIEYEIEEYDGIEWVAEKHRTWA